MDTRSVLRELDALSAGQWGLLTTAQAERRGVSRVQVSRLGAAGRLRRVSQGIYLDAGVPEGVFTHVQAAWLASDPSRTAEERLADPRPGVVVGGATAAYLLGIGDLQPEPVELLVATGRRSTRRGVRHRHREVPAGQVTIAAGLPVTAVARTIADLVADRTDLSLVADVLRDAVQQRRVDLGAIADVLDSDTFEVVVRSAGLNYSGAEQAVTMLAKLMARAIEPDYLDNLTAGLRQLAATTVARELAASVNLEPMGEQLRELMRRELPAESLEGLQRQLADAVRPALAAAQAATLARACNARSAVAATTDEEDQ